MFSKTLIELFVASSKVHNNLSEVLRLISIKLLIGFDIQTVILCTLGRDGLVKPEFHFGIEISELNFPNRGFHIADRTPCSDAIKEQRIISLDSLPNIPEIYRRTFEPRIPERIRSLASVPVLCDGIVFGTLLCLSTRKTLKQKEVQEVLEIVGMCLGAILHNKNLEIDSSKIDSHSHIPLKFMEQSDSNKELTERQLLILQMMSDGRTNSDIADLLGYSESLIRQETIRIYSRLRCSGRTEAIRIFKDKALVSAAPIA